MTTNTKQAMYVQSPFDINILLHVHVHVHVHVALNKQR